MLIFQNVKKVNSNAIIHYAFLHTWYVMEYTNADLVMRMNQIIVVSVSKLFRKYHMGYNEDVIDIIMFYIIIQLISVRIWAIIGVIYGGMVLILRFVKQI